MNLEEYHNKIWNPLIAKVKRYVKNKPLLRKCINLLEAHFVILGILGIIKTPKGKSDCYYYIIFRSKNWKHKLVKRRFQIIKKILLKAIKN